MRRLVGAFVAAALVPAGAGVAGARPRPAVAGERRVVTQEYAPNPQKRIEVDPGRVTGSQGISVTTVEFFPRPGERAVVVKAEDDWGSPVRIDVQQGRTMSGMFCAGSDDPVPIREGELVVLEIYSGACGGAAGVATTGVVEVTFLRRAASS